MVILTGATSRTALRENGEVDTNFSFGAVIEKTANRAKELGYIADIYDLGTLGFGETFTLENQELAEQGYYSKEVIKGYQSKSLFKPSLVKKCLQEHNNLTVYIDGDAELRGSLEEVETDDYDVGVTLRDPTELDSEWHKAHFSIVKYLNAGVIFFNPTQATFQFVDMWEQRTEALGNDQMALNELACPSEYPAEGSIEVINGVRVKYFPCRKFNYYYFKNKLALGVKIMHFKGDVRYLYPFSLTTRIQCSVIVLLKAIRNIFVRR